MDRRRTDRRDVAGQEFDGFALTRRSLVGAGIGGVALAAVPGALAQANPPPASPSQPGALTTAPVTQAGLGPRLTLHAIDNFHGTPGAGMVCDLSIREGDAYRPIKTVTTAANGRTSEPLLSEDALKVGHYELLMHFEAYFAKTGATLPSPNFLGLVPVRFVIRDASQRYHLPVLFTPWGYSYYRGS
ncbi:hydroxyisourate hydrolase [Methylobacterium sp. Leaf87]|uniref:hydroxyisourate hydrolase n=1 Tax=Methylobacterium sp. Leaf87 TaxID=1736243 RepID=UPI0009EA8D13|nr:hydroxyisourate hydrolase [Methylobacterium sp. Leaf87]